MKFKKEFLQNIGYIHNVIIDYTRWSVKHCGIFEFEGKLYQT